MVPFGCFTPYMAGLARIAAARIVRLWRSDHGSPSMLMLIPFDEVFTQAMSERYRDLDLNRHQVCCRA